MVIAGPQWHRIHHSLKAEHSNKNFAAFFPFIDLMFGTYYHPAQNDYPQTGLVHRNSETDLELATLSPVREWISLFARTRARS